MLTSNSCSRLKIKISKCKSCTVQCRYIFLLIRLLHSVCMYVCMYTRVNVRTIRRERHAVGRAICERPIPFLGLAPPPTQKDSLLLLLSSVFRDSSPCKGFVLRHRTAQSQSNHKTEERRGGEGKKSYE